MDGNSIQIQIWYLIPQIYRNKKLLDADRKKTTNFYDAIGGMPLFLFFFWYAYHSQGLPQDQLKLNYGFFSQLLPLIDLPMHLEWVDWPIYFSLWLPVHCSRLNYTVNITCLMWLLTQKKKLDVLLRVLPKALNCSYYMPKCIREIIWDLIFFWTPLIKYVDRWILEYVSFYWCLDFH